MSLRRGLAVVVAFALATSSCSVAAAAMEVSAQAAAKPRPSLYVATGGEPYQLFAAPRWCTAKLDNRVSARPVYVYDTITTRGTAGRLPVLPYFKRACS